MADRKNSDAAPGRHSHAIPAPSFPTHNSPRTWFLTQGLSPLAVRLMRLLLAHGDYVVACLPPHELADEARSAAFRELASECRAPTGRFKDREGWKERIRGIRCDGRQRGQCAAAVAEAVQVFGRIDIVLCDKSEALVGACEEWSSFSFSSSSSSSSSSLLAPVADQFDTVFFSQVHAIQAALPQLRAQRTGHVIVLSSTAAPIGMPGLSLHTAATAALEGYCDSLAYEIAPFNIKVTVVQPDAEVLLLTNRIVLAPALPAYSSLSAAAAVSASASAPPSSQPSLSPASPADDAWEGSDAMEATTADGTAGPPPPTVRDMLVSVLNAHPDTAIPPPDAPGSKSPQEPISRYPRLPAAALDRLVLETVHALAAIGGHENPPSRHIVGFEASAAVQDKLRTISEELEDFVEASLAVDIFDSELKAEARKGRITTNAAPAASVSATASASASAAVVMET